MSNLHLLENVHEDLELPCKKGKLYCVKGKYKYYHYVCDKIDDRGWGCGYRTLQTLCSWISMTLNKGTVPSIKNIQETLVRIEDKPTDFIGSKNWIGSVEVCLVIDTLYDVSSKIIHVNRGNELRGIVPTLIKHFEDFGSPVMMGGDKDCSSKGIMGVFQSNNEYYLLIVDPHFVGVCENRSKLHNLGFVKWQNINDFLDSSFYNLCLPQLKYSR